MILHAYDESEPIFGPGDFFGPQQHLCDLCILTFSHVIQEELLRRFPLRRAASVSSAGGYVPIYLFEYAGKTLAVCTTGIGATKTGTDLLEINWLVGAEKFIMFGSAGSLDQAAVAGKYVIPTEAYRDEGLSYHYAPPADYIRIRNADRMAEIFSELGLPWVKGRVWTTDAVYRETRNKVMARKAEGCLAVEMELAGVQAVCDFHGFELWDFLVTGDVLDAPRYDPSGLSGANHDLDKLWIALEIAKRI